MFRKKLLPTNEQLREIVTEVGQIAVQQFGRSIKSQTKADGSTVTPVDIAINQALRKWSRQFSALGYIGEEGNGDTDKEYILYVDPYDGTNTLERGMATGTVIASVMHVQNGRGLPMDAVIHNPMTGEIWHALRTAGALKGDRHGTTELSVAPPSQKIRTAVCAWPGASHNLERVSDSMRDAYSKGFSDQQMGAFGIGGGLIAQGTLDATACGEGSARETAAMLLLAQEAGGVGITITNGEVITDFALGKFKGQVDFLLPDGAIIAKDLETARRLRQLIMDIGYEHDPMPGPDSLFYTGHPITVFKS